LLSYCFALLSHSLTRTHNIFDPSGAALAAVYACLRAKLSTGQALDSNSTSERNSNKSVSDGSLLDNVKAFTSKISFVGADDEDSDDEIDIGQLGVHSSSSDGVSNIDILQWAAEAAAPSSTTVRSSLAAADEGLRRLGGCIVHVALELEGMSMES
jgi:hypothetical protein